MTRVITLTEDQRQLVEFRPEGNLLIRGEAGSGKTTVLAARAKRIEDTLNTGSLLFLTFNRSLVAYVRTLLEQFGASESIRIATFHEWSAGFAESLGYRPARIVKDDERRERLADILRRMKIKWGANHLISEPVEFWSQEIEWIFGQAIDSFEQYNQRPRSGRGTAVQVRGEDRNFIWEVFEEYRLGLQKENECDIDDYAGLVLRAVKSHGDKYPADLRYDHVFIDEVQDFDMAWLLAVAPIPRVSLTMAGDLAQRIYRRNFTWKDAGIEISAARSRLLRGSHRTTREIARVALAVATNADLLANEDFVAPTIPDRAGPKVARIQRDRWWQAEEAAAMRAARLLRENPGDTVVVAVLFNSKLSNMQDHLSHAGAKALILKGDDFSKIPERTVIVTTYHQLKGLEFDHLVLTGLEDDSMPGWYFKLSDSEKEVEKEQYLRRLIYVAMTRAKKSVTLAGARPFSRFFKDVPEEFFEEV